MTTFFNWSLLFAALLCTAVFSFILIFAIVIMPGIGQLDDGNFLRAFQVIDGVIQRNQPVFVAIWIGSVIMLLLTTGLSLDGSQDVTDGHRTGLIIATSFYLLAQVTTFTINVPLNNRVKHLDIHYLDATNKQTERQAFENKWNNWNWFRTWIFGGVSIYLLVLLKDS